MSIVYEDANYNNLDIGFQVCDDGFRDSCNSSKWPEEWYGVYDNPYRGLVTGGSPRRGLRRYS